VEAVPESRSDTTLRRDFDRQVENLIDKGYPGVAGLPEDAFRQRLAPLAERLADLPAGATDEDRIPFVIVVSGELVPTHEAIALAELRGKQGFTSMEADDLKRFVPVAGVEPPPGSAYLVTDIDTGRETLNVIPDDAIDTINADGRSPLTIEEGVALVTHHPDVLRTMNCFSLPGSRCGDRRVTAVWVSAGRPRLGWCWAGAPHTWLGSASCARRVGG
jgi:uncharacterized protein DUF5701